jgi:hypothetical protein
MRGTPVLVVGLAALAGLAGCGDNAAFVPDAAPPAAPRPQGSPATSDLVINEIAPRGAGADWIELHNRSSAPIDLCGAFLTDATDRLDHYLPLGGVMAPAPCAPRELAPGAYLVIYADDTMLVDGALIDPDHAPFQLGVADEVHLVATDGAVIDGLLYLYPPGPEASPDVTLARGPDGDGAFWPLAPTPGAANPEPPR